MLGAGALVLRGARLPLDPRTAVLHAGLAFTVGVAVASVVVVALLVAGSDLSLAWFVPAFAVVSVGLAALVRRVAGPQREAPRGIPGDTTSRRMLAVVPACLLGLYLLALLRRTLYAGVEWGDAWTFWVPRAQAIYHFGGLELGPGAFDAYPHAEYPPGLPGLDVLAFRFNGSADPLVLPLQEWLLAVAFLLALAALLRPRVPAFVLSPVLLLLVLTPSFGREIGILMGDLTIAAVFTLAGVCAVLWLLDARPELGILAGLFSASAAAVKREGLFLGLLLAVVVAFAAPLARVSRRRALLIALPPLAVAVTWALWLRLSDVDTVGDYRLSDLVDPHFLGSRIDRLGDVLTSLPSYLLDPREWFLALPVSIAAALLARRRAPIVARVILVLVPAAFVGLVAVYWISLQDLQFHLETSAGRIPGPVVFLCLALLPLLAASLDERPDGGRDALPPPEL